MNFLFDPNVAYVLLVGGFILAILALFSPGTGLLEIGALFVLVLAGYSIYNLAFNWWAIIILLLGVFPFLLALRKSRRWYFLLISIASLVVGSIFMFQSVDGKTTIDPALAVVVSITATGMIWFIGTRSIEALGQEPAQDLKRLVSMQGQARTVVFTDGTVYVNGEEWSARSLTSIPAGSSIVVTSREGLVLLVEPAGETTHQ
jgi:membrane-bound serine protease (ClpP class)